MQVEGLALWTMVEPSMCIKYIKYNSKCKNW